MGLYTAIAFFSILILIALKVSDPALVSAKIFFDKNNIPMVDYGIMDGINIGKQYNPVTISHDASKYYTEFIKNENKTSKTYFLKHVNWLVDNSVKKDNYTFFAYDFPFPPYDLKAPWYSAMAQGAPIQSLLNAYNITQDKTYLTTAKNALNVLFIDINDPCKCGVTYKTLADGWWFEEYANGHENGPRVLNGMMFTLVDIYHYYNFTQDPDALYLFNQGILSLKNNLHNYDKNGTYSSYDKNKGDAPMLYHKVHLCLLDKLYNITKENLFKQYLVNWTKGYNHDLSANEKSEDCF